MAEFTRKFFVRKFAAAVTSVAASLNIVVTFSNNAVSTFNGNNISTF